MLFTGIILAIGGVLAALVLFLSNLNIFGDMKEMGGLGKWLAFSFQPENISGQKIAFFIAIFLVILGIILYFVGKARAAKTGEADAASTKGFKFFRDLKGEFKKITWPTLNATARNTGVTLAMCAIMGVIICLIDLGLGQLIKLMLG